MGRPLARLMGVPSPKQIRRQQEEMIQAQRQLAEEQTQRAEALRREEETKAAEKASEEMRARMAISQGRRANRVASNVRETLNRMGLLG